MADESSSEPVTVRSAVAMGKDGEIILDLTTDDGLLLTFKLLHPEITLESLQHAIDSRKEDIE